MIKKLLIIAFASLLIIGVPPAVYASVDIDDQVKSWETQAKVHYCIAQPVTAEAIQFRASGAQGYYIDNKAESKIKAYRRQQLNIGYVTDIHQNANETNRAPKAYNAGANAPEIIDRL